MIPGAEGAAAVGNLLFLLAILIGVLLLSWWGWRLWHERRGTARPPLRVWQWAAVLLLSVLPVSTTLMWVQFVWADYQRERNHVQLQQQRYFTLPQTIIWGDMVLPAGGHAERELLGGEERLRWDTSDLRTMTGVRFEQTQPLGDLFVNALGLNGDWLLLELDRSHRFGKEDCPAGYTAQFKALEPRTVLEDVPSTIYEAVPLRMANWRFDTCFNERAIMMQYWRGSNLVWMEPPDYGLD